MKHDLRLGPFINEDGDIWVPATVGGIVVARQKAAEAAWGRFRFVDMEEATMSLHEAGSIGHPDGIDGDGDEDAAIEACEETTEAGPCTWIGRAYHFREVD